MQRMQRKSMLPPPEQKRLSRKPGFLTLAEFFQQQESFFEQCRAHNGELLLVELKYMFRTRYGGPEDGFNPMESTRYLLGVINCAEGGKEGSQSAFIPVGNYICWENGNMHDLLKGSAPLSFGSSGFLLGCHGDIFLHFSVGNDALLGFLTEHVSNDAYWGERTTLRFWEAARTLKVDISHADVVARALKNQRGEALRTYVHDKKVLSLDGSREGQALARGAVRSHLTLDIQSAYLRLQALGLSKEEITTQAGALVLESLDL